MAASATGARTLPTSRHVASYCTPVPLSRSLTGGLRAGSDKRDARGWWPQYLASSLPHSTSIFL